MPFYSIRNLDSDSKPNSLQSGPGTWARDRAIEGRQIGDRGSGGGKKSMTALGHSIKWQYEGILRVSAWVRVRTRETKGKGGGYCL